MAKLGLQEIEIGRLGDELGGAILAGQAPPLIVAIGGHHHHRQIGPPCLDLAQQLQPVDDRHVYVRQDHDQLRLDARGKLVECFLTRIGEMQDIGALAHLATKLLAEQLGDIGLVIDDQDADGHLPLPAGVACRRRGSRTMNSVNSPSRLSTVIVPPCCVVTMSWLIERPRPVPSPVGLVVKNGWNSLSRCSGAMPAPLSRTRISTALPRARVVTFSTGRNESPASQLRLLAA